MSDQPTTARAVIIGAGIVGNSLAYHLAELGWTDLVLIDKGPFPNPGGSTGHASNFIFPVDHSKEMTALTLDSMRQYKELDVFTESGGIEVARTEERMQELRRRIKGEVRFDDGSRALYASDASNYRQVPIGVVVPHDEDDVIACYVGRLTHAQPVYPPGFAAMLPPVQTAIAGLQIADTCFYYPEDRGIAESVRLGKTMAERIPR